MLKGMEVLINVYVEEELIKFLESKNPEDVDPGDEWKKVLNISSSIEFPVAHQARMRLQPEQIVRYMECFSMKEAHENPDSPVFDCVGVTMEDGEELSLAHSYEEFERMLSVYYEALDKE